jgi:hypothetical protein
MAHIKAADNTIVVADYGASAHRSKQTKAGVSVADNLILVEFNDTAALSTGRRVTFIWVGVC